MVLEILCGFVEANDRSRLGQYIYFLQFYRVSIRCKFINAFEASRGLIFICTQAGISLEKRSMSMWLRNAISDRKFNLIVCETEPEMMCIIGAHRALEWDGFERMGRVASSVLARRDCGRIREN